MDMPKESLIRRMLLQNSFCFKLFWCIADILGFCMFHHRSESQCSDRQTGVLCLLSCQAQLTNSDMMGNW